MTPPTPDPELVQSYEEKARAYYRSLPPEHTIDPVSQGETRKITLFSFSVIRADRADIQCFNELLIRYPRPNTNEYGRVVPNNFVVIHPEPIRAYDSFDTDAQPVGPTLVIDYVHDYRNPAGYENNFDRYGRELAVPYYLRVLPAEQEFTLYRLAAGKYEVVPPNEAGRHPMPELELEAALLDGWVRFWFRGELLPLPADLQQQRDEERAGRLAAEHRAEVERCGRLAAEAELARLREELARAKGQP